MTLPQKFYNRPTLRVAQDLLGCFLVVFPAGKTAATNAAHANDVVLPKGKIKRFMIVETEAYNGPRDLASHASRGKTERNSVMFGKPGIIYVYFTYGMHYMFNIVTGAKDYPAAVLIRAVAPNPNPSFSPSGRARGAKRSNLVQDEGARAMLTNGPAKLTKYLGIDKSFNGLPVYVKKYGLWIEGREREQKPLRIARATRVGVDYAGKYKEKKWRFYIKDSKFVSKK